MVSKYENYERYDNWVGADSYTIHLLRKYARREAYDEMFHELIGLPENFKKEVHICYRDFYPNPECPEPDSEDTVNFFRRLDKTAKRHNFEPYFKMSTEDGKGIMSYMFMGFDIPSIKEPGYD